MGAIAGAISGQISIFKEAVTDEAIKDGGNYSPRDVGEESLKMGFLNPKQVIADAVAGAVSVGVGRALRQIGTNTGLIPKEKVPDYRIINYEYVPMGGGRAVPALGYPLRYKLPTTAETFIRAIWDQSIDLLEEYIKNIWA